MVVGGENWPLFEAVEGERVTKGVSATQREVRNGKLAIHDAAL